MQLDREIKDLLSLRQKFHSEFQIDRFILWGKSSTLWGLVKQALAEIDSRWDQLRREKIEHKKAKAEIESLRCQVQEKELRLEELERTMTDRERELRHFTTAAAVVRDSLIAEHGEITEDVRRLLEEEDQVAKLRFRVALDLASEGRISRGVGEAVHALSRKHREEVLSLVGDGEKVRRELMDGSGPRLETVKEEAVP